MSATWIETRDVPVDQLTRFPGNAKRGDVKAIRESIRRNGQYRAIVVRKDGDALTVLAGNHTLDAIAAEDHETIRCEIITCSDDEAKRINLADNRMAELGTYDDDALLALLSELDGDLDGTGWTEDDLDLLIQGGSEESTALAPKSHPPLAEDFVVPPFDVLNAQSAIWQDRKRQWLELGVQSEVGRSESLAYHDTDFSKAAGVTGKTGTSIFDPVLCEIAYRWFSSAGHTVLDPFAGGSVRGLIAGMLGRAYVGNDLSDFQIEENRRQERLLYERGLIAGSRPVWTVGDSAQWAAELPPESVDLIFTCPPYYDLEYYSDDPADISRMLEADFNDAYRKILTRSAAALRTDRFAVIVTGNVRGKSGRIKDLREVTVSAMESAGLTYVSDAVLLTMIASAGRRARAPFLAHRTLTRVHQDVSVFCKGDRAAAARESGEVDVYLPEEDQ